MKSAVWLSKNTPLSLTRISALLKVMAAFAVPVYVRIYDYHYDVIVCVSFGSLIQSQCFNTPGTISTWAEWPGDSLIRRLFSHNLEPTNRHSQQNNHNVLEHSNFKVLRCIILYMVWILILLNHQFMLCKILLIVKYASYFCLVGWIVIFWGAFYKELGSSKLYWIY